MTSQNTNNVIEILNIFKLLEDIQNEGFICSFEMRHMYCVLPGNEICKPHITYRISIHDLNEIHSVEYQSTKEIQEELLNFIRSKRALFTELSYLL